MKGFILVETGNTSGLIAVSTIKSVFPVQRWDDQGQPIEHQQCQIFFGVTGSDDSWLVVDHRLGVMKDKLDAATEG